VCALRGRGRAFALGHAAPDRGDAGPSGPRGRGAGARKRSQQAFERRTACPRGMGGGRPRRPGAACGHRSRSERSWSDRLCQKAAAAIGARWAILQPPPLKGVPEIELIRFFGAIADSAPIPLAVQNAPEYLGIGFSHAGIKTLNKQHPNIGIVKLEASAVAIARLREEVEGAVDIFNGRAGIEMTDAPRAGAIGIIPGGGLSMCWPAFTMR